MASALGVAAAVGVFDGAEPEQREAGAVAVSSTTGSVTSVIVVDWDAGTADWENINDESVVGEVQFRYPETLDKVTTIATGYDPQIALSGDGSRLAIAETVSVGLSPVQRLRVFDISDGISEITVTPLEDRLLTTGDVAPGVVAMSNDGRFAFVEGYVGNHYWIDSYDVQSGGALAGRVDLPDLCGISTILPVSTEATFVAVCKGPAAAAVIAEPLTGAATTLAFEGAGQFINGVPVGGSASDIVAAAISSDGATAYAVARSGTAYVIDIAAGSVTDVVALEIGAGAVSPDQLALVNGLMYVGIGVGDEVFEGRSSSVRAFDPSGYILERVIASPIQFSSFSVSPEQGLVYLVDRRFRQLAIADGVTGQEIKLIADAGGVPDFIALR